MNHKTVTVSGGKPFTFDWFCECGVYGIGYGKQEVSIFTESHEKVANEHDQKLEQTGKCIHGGHQHAEQAR